MVSLLMHQPAPGILAFLSPFVANFLFLFFPLEAAATVLIRLTPIRDCWLTALCCLFSCNFVPRIPLNPLDRHLMSGSKYAHDPSIIYGLDLCAFVDVVAAAGICCWCACKLRRPGVFILFGPCRLRVCSFFLALCVSDHCFFALYVCVPSFGL